MRTKLVAVAIVCFGVGCGGSSETDLLQDSGSDGTTGNDSGGGNDATTNPDGNPNPGNDGGVIDGSFTDAGNPTTIACGNSTCTLPTQTCCVSGNGTTFTCVNGTTCPQNQTGLHCLDTASCAPGLICCVNQQQNVTTSNCKVACGQNEAQLCDSKLDGGTGCVPSNAQCSSQNIQDWGLNPPFATCGGKGN